jgi:predicted porin
MRKLLVVLAAFAFVLAYTLPAMADDQWDFYGSARVLTFNTTVSEEASGLGVEDEDLTHVESGSARTIGARVKAGDISARFEAGGTLNLRLAYATWKFGAGSLRVGQDYTPGDYFPSGMVYGDNSMVSYGASYTGRIPQVKLLLGGLQVALIQPNVRSAAGLAGVNDTDTSMPKIEVAYSLKLGPAALKFFAGVNTHDDVVIAGTSETTYTVDSNLFGVGFSIPFGALYVKGNVWASTNPANYGMATLAPAANAATYVAADDSVEDADSMAYALVVGYKVSDMIKLEGGYGYVDGEVGDTDAEKTFMYVQVPITLAKNVVLTPEFGAVDYGEVNDVEQGDMNYWGLRWMINF